jgi:hypothetical protein
LDDDALALIERVWSRGPKEELFAEGPGARLTRKDLLTLRGLDWLNDEVINFYINLVAERSTESKDLPKVRSTRHAGMMHLARCRPTRSPVSSTRDWRRVVMPRSRVGPGKWTSSRTIYSSCPCI